eukprot:TRINITY_DN3565_c0_g1_i1.p2 TRINITY_DN3565_c0_g1~~TRINITY_DN3565_c0_g1_i1.p2  ORF type:complete len:152 (+),score=33.93 TRINITY_DN3565_c0_g1_i1:1085-1540(+)
MIDPKIAERVSKEFGKNSIVVFDEAHNIDNTAIECMSVNLDSRILKRAKTNLNTLEKAIEKAKKSDSQRLQSEYQKLVEGLANTGNVTITDDFRANPVLPQDMLLEAVPGNIRRSEHFVRFMRRFVQYMRERLKAIKSTKSEKPLKFLHDL